MAQIITMPQLSDTMEEGRILEWRKAEGEDLATGDILAEIESDKADVEFEVFRQGVLHKILVPEGDTAPVGAPIAIVGKRDEDISEALAGVDSTKVKATEKVAAVSAEKEKEAKARARKTEEARAKVEEQKKAEAEREPGERVKASPVALRLAAELGVDVSRVSGSGPGGRVIKRDVEAAAKAPAEAAKPKAEAPPKEEKAPAKKEKAPPAEAVRAPTEAEFEELPLSGMRKTIARRLVESMGPVPHFYVSAQIDMAQALEAKAALEKLRETKVTVTDLVVKACGLALIRHPQINSSFQGDSVRRYKEAHVGVVVATEEGLIIPVVRSAQAKALSEVAKETADLAERGRKRKLKTEEYRGATFTVSNLGMFGVESFTAVIATPEGAILSVGAVKEKPVVRKGHVEVGKTMSVTLGCDHRIIDGTEAAAFLNDLKELLENPVSLFI